MSGGPVNMASGYVVGRYALYGEIASGGMARVHIGRLLGPVGFSRTVAIKRLHAAYACDPEFVAMFLDEARLAARIRHPNVVATLDVVALDGELFLVMDYVHGETLGRLVRGAAALGEEVPLRVIAAILSGTLHGLHAAHEATNERGQALGIVHRDVSPQNILVGSDGVARVLDFGVAKAIGQSQATRDGQVKGKLAYMAPEQIGLGATNRRTDIFAASVVLWEALTRRRLFQAETNVAVVAKVLDANAPRVSDIAPNVPPELDAIVARGLAKDPEERYATARDMAIEIEQSIGLAAPREVGEWVDRIAHAALLERATRLAEVERFTSSSQPPPAMPAPGPRAIDPDADTRASHSAVSEGLSAITIPTRKTPWLTVVVAVALLAGGVVLLWPKAEAPGAPTSSSAASPESASAPPAASPESASAPPAASPASPDGSAAGSSSPPRAVPAPSLSGLTVPPAAPAPAKKADAPQKKGGCSPPYTLDADGVRHIKPECL